MRLETGVEFQATKELSITPFVNYTDATSSRHQQQVGLRGEGQLLADQPVGRSRPRGRDNMVNTTYSVGLNFRF